MTEQEEIAACKSESIKHDWPYVQGVFRERFVSICERYRERVGQKFTIIRQIREIVLYGEDDMYLIRFEDGTEMEAFGEEVCICYHAIYPDEVIRPQEASNGPS